MKLHRTKARAQAVIAAGALAASTTGCIADNEALVFVEPILEEPKASVDSGALGTSLTGSFRLRLRLGPRASGPSQVSIQKFEITNADQSKSIVSPLETTAEPAFPLTVKPDSDVSALLTIDLGGGVLPQSTAEGLCDAGGIKIAGLIQDSLEDGASPVDSAVFDPSGCP